MKLDGKVAVITGAASGIGAGTARRFAAEGAKVVVADLEEDKGKAVADEVGGTFVRCDVAVEAEVERAIATAVDTYGRLDVCFANAGFGGVGGLITDLDAEGTDRTMAVLLKGVALCMKHAAKVLIAQGEGGSIISTASVAGVNGGYGPHIYTACKHAVIGLTKSVSTELAPYGIRVNAICPGGIVTNIFGAGMGAEGEAAERVMQFMSEALKHAQPIKRAGLPADIAAAATFLASDDSSFITGQSIVVDGGMTATGRREPAPGAAGGAGPFAQAGQQQAG